MKKRTPRNYIDNERFLTEILKYQEKIKEAEENNTEKPIVPNYIAECFVKIADGLANRPNFVNYSYIEDMKMDGIENCLQYMHNFNAEKTKNPFAYFTQIIWWAFVRRIEKENKSTYVAMKYSQHVNTFNLGSHSDEHDDTYQTDDLPISEYSEDYMNNFIEKFETNKNNKKKKKDKS